MVSFHIGHYMTIISINIPVSSSVHTVYTELQGRTSVCNILWSKPSPGWVHPSGCQRSWRGRGQIASLETNNCRITYLYTGDTFPINYNLTLDNFTQNLEDFIGFCVFLFRAMEIWTVKRNNCKLIYSAAMKVEDIGLS